MDLRAMKLQAKSENAGQPGLVFLNFVGADSAQANVTVPSGEAASFTTGGLYTLTINPAQSTPAAPSATPTMAATTGGSH